MLVFATLMLAQATAAPAATKRESLSETLYCQYGGDRQPALRS